MHLDPDQCFRALKAHDARFDGRFFVGVGSTRVYCRPVCTARTPLRKNCSFFPSAAAAENEGYRPCLRCRPELAPGYATVDANRRLARAAANRIEDGRLEGASLEDLAAKLGVTDRHLRRVFKEEFGVSPVEYAQTQRLLLAKRLLTDTALPVVEVAMASGFASLRRFNDLFKARYRMTPMELRSRTPSSRDADRLVFDLAYRPPYEWSAMLAFLEGRAVKGVEAVDARRYRRTVRLDGAKPASGWLEVAPSPRKSALRVTASSSLAGALPLLLARVKSLFDLACRPDEIAAALGPLAEAHPGLRLPGAMDGFEIAVRGILGQQVTVKAATTIAGRFTRAFGEAIETPHEGLERLFPTPRTIAAASPGDIAAHGIIRARAHAIHALATAMAQGRLALEPDADVEGTLAALQSIRGIGPWTAHYIALRALAWPDAFPHPDVAVLKAMKETNGRRALAAAEAWRPFRAYAVLHLWKSLEPLEENAMTRFARIPTPLGTVIAIAAGGALTGIHFEGGRHVPPVSTEWREDPYHEPLRRCAEQLADYFEGKRQCFDLPIAPRGTDFQQRVWREIARVPYGETITYSQLAERAGAPGSARAAGAATGRNPLSILVPCHRVVATDGSLTGYAGGLARKEKLLALEGALAEAAA